MMFGFGRCVGRGIPTKDNKIYCPFHHKTVSSEDELGPRNYRNRVMLGDSADEFSEMGRGMGLGFRRCFFGRGLGRRNFNRGFGHRRGICRFRRYFW